MGPLASMGATLPLPSTSVISCPGAAQRKNGTTACQSSGQLCQPVSPKPSSAATPP
eukprot:CAMPEP_0195067598 /NCGR_PEP_ID=MMETSP0448-20130528/12604_1 /TAXON_ID=66468 /ORGANISM="Heterocapsa triquestra, Strain CCMP 448" /LENGTH=55 /DNA_ID=CAMNT_0040099027 /DNA_START=98 /DNA_END=261 /DNA_ORIENTATION=+